ncbi:SURF1 family protein [Microbacterium sp. ASV49]|uniref:SURF1-like protein n=1 Tax=Microbacterium candidum TaxID=3041922 RepID=A0ABT7MX85_9MICO|nr:SURF1 family cytochrome oxidase biogenesis protein [Microbacterium sp. ASV49]MDL9979068.1 SURF1 family cytochrome oxidase biogenesis protein [Microbacterium sp. ASV49]
MTEPSAPAPQQQVFPPTLREVMVRPRWIAMLLLCLVVAGVFAWLGQWQLGRAIDTAPVAPSTTEHVEPIADVVKPGEYLDDRLVGQKVAVSGSWVPGDFIVVSSRFNDNVEGYWVTGQLRVADTAAPTSIAVAVGWTPDRAKADSVASALNASGGTADVTGRLISDEGPVTPPEARPYELTTMSPAALLGRWHHVKGLNVYRPYLTSEKPLGGLEAISSPAPSEHQGVNWLNLFYAAEWAVFAGFAFYLWYRLAKDAWEKEIEELEEAAAAGIPKSENPTESGPDGGGDPS